MRLQQLLVPHQHRAAGDESLNPLTGNDRQIAGRGNRDLPPLGFGDDAIGQWMLTQTLGRSRNCQQIFNRVRLDRQDGRDLRLAKRYRAGLVEHDGGERAGRFQRRGILDQNAAGGSATAGDEDGRLVLPDPTRRDRRPPAPKWRPTVRPPIARQRFPRPTE